MDVGLSKIILTRKFSKHSKTGVHDMRIAAKINPSINRDPSSSCGHEYQCDEREFADSDLKQEQKEKFDVRSFVKTVIGVLLVIIFVRQCHCWKNT